MGTHARRATSTTARALRALVVVVFALAVVVAPAWTASAATTQPVTCDDLVDQQLRAELAEAQYTFFDTSGADTGGVENHPDAEDWTAWGHLGEGGGLTCWWFQMDGSEAAAIGYALLDDETDLVTRLTDAGYAPSQTPDGAVFSRYEPLDLTQPEVSYPAQEVLIGEGVVMAGRGFAPELLAQIRARILPLLDIPEPSTPTPLPTEEPVTEPVAIELAEEEPVVAEPIAGGRLAEGPGAPSTYDGLRTGAQLDLRPVVLACTVALVLVFAAILAFPGKLLESAVQEHYDRVSRLWAPASRLIGRIGRGLHRGGQSLPIWMPVAFGLVAAAVIAGFVDPSFGFNAGSVRMVASSLVSFIVEGVVAALVVGAVAVRWGVAERPRVRLLGGALVLLVVTVVLSRVTGFVPGVVFGVLLGAVLPATVSQRDTLRLALVEVGYVATLAIVAFAGYSALAEPLGETGGVLDTFAVEALAATAVVGFSALPVMLLPFAGMPGGVLFARSRWWWLATWTAATIAFMIVLLPFPASWEETSTPFWLWISLFAVYAAVAVGVWWWLTATATAKTVAAKQESKRPSR